MTGDPRRPGIGDSRDDVAGDGGPTATGAPRWVKAMALIALVLVLLLIVLHLTGNSLGGPGSHGSSGEQVVQLP